ncbi:MAG TPA: hypothetical protein VEA60_04755, partial [Allosphingosinicella sp.]|nr:hypothetical protein [Allosphingosinicella sp.]
MPGPIFAALLLATAGGPVQVDVGRADWDSMPPLKVERRLPTADMVGQVERILLSGECSLAGQTARRFDITVPYAVLVEPDGGARRVVVAETGCAPLESYVGLVVLTMADAGDFRSSGEAKAR